MRLILTFLAFVCAAQAALPWRWSNPRPHGNHIYEQALRGDTYIQVGDKGAIYTSEDLETWRAERSGTTQSLRSIAFLGTRAIISGANGTIVWSDDLRAFHVVQLPTSAWLEGVASSATMAVAVGDNGVIFTSANGADWTQRSSGTTEWLTGVAYRNGFIAVGENSRVLESADGATWSASVPALFSGKHLFSVSTINDQAWAVGEAGLIAVLGPRGWSLSPSGVTNDLYAIAGSTNELVAAGEGALLLKEGAGAWVSQTSASAADAAPAWPYYSALWDGRLFRVGGRSGVAVEGFRTNSAGPMQWHLADESPRDWLWSVTQQGSLFAAVGNNGRIMTSSQGAFWDEENSGLTNGQYLLGIGGRTNLLVAVGSAGAILTSPDVTEPLVTTNGNQTVTNQVGVFGIRWTRQNSGTTRDLQGIAASPTLLVASGADGRIFRSANGSAWTGVVTPVTTFLSGVAHLNGAWVAVGDRGTILSSPDALLWTQRSSGTTNWIYQVRALNGQFVAVGENGAVLTSPNGSQWTARNTGASRFPHWLNDVAYAAGKYYAVSDRGAVAQSADAIIWTGVGSLTSHSLYGVAANSFGKLVVVGNDGVILRARLTPFAGAVRIAGYNRSGGASAFLFSGEIDQPFKLQGSSDLVGWSDLADLEISDENGAILHLQPDSGASRQFFRTVTTEP